MMEDKLLLTIDEAAQRLGIGRSHAYVYVMKGEIESVKLGRSRRVPATALENFVEKLRTDSDD
ncbi:MAG: helix-turn-helix domain-containing protein [Dehalococcoidia bacterium]|nr:helix-turn-helix domain-containing protein [Dehalococcoidia bacterium]